MYCKSTYLLLFPSLSARSTVARNKIDIQFTEYAVDLMGKLYLYSNYLVSQHTSTKLRVCSVNIVSSDDIVVAVHGNLKRS